MNSGYSHLNGENQRQISCIVGMTGNQDFHPEHDNFEITVGHLAVSVKKN